MKNIKIFLMVILLVITVNFAFGLKIGQNKVACESQITESGYRCSESDGNAQLITCVYTAIKSNATYNKLVSCL